MKFKKKHLSEAKIAMYAEALKFNATKQLDNHLINHVEACGDCQLMVSEIYELIKSDKNITFKGHRYSDKKINLYKNNIVNLKLYIAVASLIIFILLFSALFRTGFTTKKKNLTEIVSIAKVKENFTQNKEPEINKNLTNNNISKAEIKENNYTENFKEFPALEGMVNTGLRNVIDFKLIAPSSGKIFGKSQAISFKWKIQDDAPLNIVIYNNKGEMIHTSDNTINRYILRDKLVTGLYYWKLLSKEKDIIYVGKFLIN
jgi:hypothetical protein